MLKGLLEGPAGLEFARDRDGTLTTPDYHSQATLLLLLAVLFEQAVLLFNESLGRAKALLSLAGVFQFLTQVLATSMCNVRRRVSVGS